MESVKLEKAFTKRGKPAKWILKRKDTGEIFKIIGGVKIKGENKLVLERDDKKTKLICSPKLLIKNYIKIGTYGEEENN
jgi:hypothetical protein